MPEPYDIASFAYREHPGKPQRPYQREIHQRTALMPYRAAFWDPRTGKSRLVVETFAALYEARRANGCAVIAPNRVHEAWPDQFAEWTPLHLLDKLSVGVYRSERGGTKKQAAAMAELRDRQGMSVLCISYDAVETDEGWATLRSFLQTRACLTAADESGRIKTPTIKLTERMLGYYQKVPKSSPPAYRLVEGVYDWSEYRRILDGTPAPNEPWDVYCPVAFLDRDFWARRLGIRDHYQHKRYFCEWGKGFRWAVVNGQKVRREYPEKGAYRNMGELQRALDAVGDRIRRAEHMPGPGKIYNPVRFDLTAEQRERYDLVAEGFSAALRDYLAGGCEGEVPSRQNALTKMLRMCEIASGFERESYVDTSGPVPRKKSRVIWRARKNPRLELAEALLSDMTCQATIWCAYRPEVDDVVRALGKKVVRFDGGMSNAEALVNKEAFRRGDVQAIVSIPSENSSFGHDFANAEEDLHYNRTWHLRYEVQAEDRTQGPAQTKRVGVTDLIARGTKDDEKQEAIARKEDIQAFLLRDPSSGRRGDAAGAEIEQMQIEEAMA